MFNYLTEGFFSGEAKSNSFLRTVQENLQSAVGFSWSAAGAGSVPASGWSRKGAGLRSRESLRFGRRPPAGPLAAAGP